MRSMVEGELLKLGAPASLPLHHPSGGPPPPAGEEVQVRTPHAMTIILRG
jgi:hypothetical protein